MQTMDPVAFSFAFIAVLLMVPVLVLLVAVLNAVFSGNRSQTRAFPWLMAGAGIVVAGTILAVLVTTSAPASFDFAVVGPTGMEFAGEVQIDGIRTRIEGTAPMMFHFQGRSFDITVIPLLVVEDHPLEVKFYGWLAGWNHSYQHGIRPFGHWGMFQSSAGLEILSASDWKRWKDSLRPDENPVQLVPVPQREAVQPIEGHEPVDPASEETSELSVDSFDIAPQTTEEDRTIPMPPGGESSSSAADSSTSPFG